MAEMLVELTVENVQRTTGSTRDHAELYLPFLIGTCKAYDITTPRRVTGFLSQIGHESQNLSRVEENLNYSVDRLLSLFGRHRISEADARKFGSIKGVQKAQPEEIANRIYGGPWGLQHLGNRRSGDGWKYRGRALKMVTGLYNCTKCSEALGENFIDFPERLTMPVNAALASGWFWHEKGLNALADKGDVRGMTLRINGGVIGLPERQALWTTGLEMFA